MFSFICNRLYAQKHVDPVDPDSDVDPEHCFFPYDVLSHPPLPRGGTWLVYLCDAPPLDLPDGGGDDEWNSSLLSLCRLLDGRLEEACRQR